jgi:hypothetical protein
VNGAERVGVTDVGRNRSERSAGAAPEWCERKGSRSRSPMLSLALSPTVGAGLGVGGRAVSEGAGGDIIR